VIDGEWLIFETGDGRRERLRLPDEIWDTEAFDSSLWRGDADAWLRYEIEGFDVDPDAVCDVPAVLADLERELEEQRPARFAVLEARRHTRELAEEIGGNVGRSALEIAAEAEPEPDWIVPGLIMPSGVTVIGGKAKEAGKSTLTAYTLAHVERAEPTVFGPPPRNPATALWVSEEPDWAIREKVVMFDLRRCRVMFAHELPTDGWRSRLVHAAEVAAADGCEIVVVDPLSRLARVEEENGRELGAAAELVGEVAQASGLAFVVIHHFREAGGGSVLDRLRGSTSLPAAVDQIVGVGVKPGNRRLLQSVGRIRAMKWEREVELDGTDYVTVDKDAARWLQLSTDRDVLARLGRATRSQWAEDQGVSVETAGEHLRALVEAGLATVSGRDGRSKAYAPATPNGDGDDP
jgi:DNA-binding transcriptional ArsR family regulator